LNSGSRTTYYDIDYRPYGGQIRIKVEAGKISEVGETGHGGQDGDVFGVSEIDLSKIDGYSGVGLLLSEDGTHYGKRNGTIPFTDEQRSVLKKRLLELAKEMDPGDSNRVDDGASRSRESRLSGKRIAGYGKTTEGVFWVEVNYVDYSYRGELR